MRKFFQRNWILLFLFFCPLFICAEEPSALYLTWLRDPTTTMTIQWHTSKNDVSSALSYKESGQQTWLTGIGDSIVLGNSTLLVHTIELTQLKPDTDYIFQLDKKEYRFRTLPAQLTRPLRFAVGGDAYSSLPDFKKMNRQIAKAAPDFIVLGGDIAYVKNNNPHLKGKRWELTRWQTFFKEWKNTMVTPEGRIIPLLPLMGNHDYTKKAHQSGNLFYQLFAFPEKNSSYRSLEFGNYLQFLFLDTGHDHPIAGTQTDWLAKTLSKKETYTYKMAAYHIAAYPSYYAYDNHTALAIRESWVPLFEKFHLQTAFEHHNHTYKRTHPIKEGKIDPKGVIYLGDGSWGVPPRTAVEASKRWYLASTASINAFWLVQLKPEHGLFESWNNEGGKIEEFTLSPIVK